MSHRSFKEQVLSTVVLGGVCVLLCGGLIVSRAGGDEPPTATGQTAIPIDDVMHYGVSYAGIHCGAMTLESFVEETAEDGPVYHIVMTARTSKFFDAIYKVRTRIESFYSGRRLSSIRYHEHSVEKGKVKDKLYVVDFEQSHVRRTEGDDEMVIPIVSQQVYDPLAFLYRVRRLVDGPGDSVTLTMMTTDGDLDTVAEVKEKARISTPFGKREALKVVPRPVDDMIFSREGTMRVWVSDDERRIPYRVEFELDFGTLVAKLKSIGG